MSELFICDESGCGQPIKLVAFDTGVDGSYCVGHLHERMKEAGVLDNDS